MATLGKFKKENGVYEGAIESITYRVCQPAFFPFRQNLPPMRPTTPSTAANPKSVPPGRRRPGRGRDTSWDTRRPGIPASDLVVQTGLGRRGLRPVLDPQIIPIFARSIRRAGLIF